MPFDGLVVRALAWELDQELKDARIDRIHQPEKEELVINIRKRSGNSRLLISANSQWARAHLTAERRENPAQPPSFCMLLRKYLEGAKVTAVSQPGWERVLVFHLLALNEFRDWREKLLICEFMGKHSNIILVDPESGLILDGIKRYGHDVSTYREVMPGRPYLPPPPQEKLDPDRAEPEEIMKRLWPDYEGKTISYALFSLVHGLSPVSARYVCMMAGVSPDLPVDECGEYELISLEKSLRDLISALETGGYNPGFTVEKGLPADFWVADPGWENFFPQDSVNNAVAYYYGARLEQSRLNSMKSNLSRHIRSHLDKLQRKRANQESDLREAGKKEKFRVWGELLTAYAHEVPRGASQVTLLDFYSGEETEIPLIPYLTPVENAQKMFKIYNKARLTRQHVAGFLAETMSEIAYLESVLTEIDLAAQPEDIDEIVDELMEQGYVREAHRKGKKARTEAASFRQFVSSDGHTILVGRNNRQNDLLTLKKAVENDLWLHTKDIPGAHVIVRLPEGISSIQQMPDAALTEAALLAGHFSKGREGGKVDVDYTFVRNVKKPKGARPGMVIYENYWTITVDLDSPALPALLAQSR